MNLFFKSFLIIIFLLFLYWLFFFRVSIDEDQEKIYTLLILNKTQEKKNSKLRSSLVNEIKSAWLLYYYYPKGRFFLLEIDENTNNKVTDGFYRSIFANKVFLKKTLNENYGVKIIDYEISFDDSSTIDFLDKWGGTSFFNLYSDYLPIGEVYITGNNYKNFLSGISNPYYRKNTSLSIWFNLLMSFQETLPHHVYVESFLEEFFGMLKTTFNYQTFKALIDPLFNQFVFDEKKLLKDNLYLKFDKTSVEQLTISSNQKIDLPYLNGAYDKDKIIKELRSLSKVDEKFGSLAIVAQIKNATEVKRLAAKAAGVFRLRGINVIEYLGFSKKLDRSVILDFSNSPLKRNYIKKITKINKVYHLFNYRESFDFSILLGKNFHAIQN